MKNIISYVLFGSEARYWCNLPYILVANSVIYPEFTTRVYVHLDATQTPTFKLLERATKFSNVEMELFSEKYQGTKPTTHRMKPLWESDVDILLCRDLDHITNKLERKAVQYFLDHEQYLIQGIRSYHLHSTPYLAGLVGFRCKEIRKRVQHLSKTFEKYITWGIRNVNYCRDWRWGCDQALLRDFFHSAGLYKVSLDCPQLTAKPVPEYSNLAAVVFVDQYEKIQLSACNKTCLSYSDSIAPSFTGQAVNVKTYQVQEFIKKADNEIGRLASEYV